MSNNHVPVYVLISTFNGEQYVRYQLDSVLEQNYPQIHIHIRDDGSSDTTPIILGEYAQRYPNISVILGANIGVVCSFMALLRLHGDSNGYFAFCDQDDIWCDDKILRAVETMQSSASPESCLYFSRLELVNKEGCTYGLSDVPRKISFGNALIENVVTGASAVFGTRIKDIFLMGRPDCMVWHDWWLYLVATAFGCVMYDEEPTIQYRRHDLTLTNLRVRSSESIAEKLLAFIRAARRKRLVHPFEQAICFGKTYQSLLDQRQLALIEKIGKLHGQRRFLDRARFAFDRDFVVNDWLDNLGLRVLVLLGLV